MKAKVRPAEYKFTQGTWEHQPYPKNTVPGNLRIVDPNKTVIYHETDQSFIENIHQQTITRIQNRCLIANNYDYTEDEYGLKGSQMLNYMGVDWDRFSIAKFSR